MSRLSRVSIALSLIAIAVNGIHVQSVESNAKINIGVNGIYVDTVESFFRKAKGYLSLFIWACIWETKEKTANVLLKTDKKKALML